MIRQAGDLIKGVTVKKILLYRIKNKIRSLITGKKVTDDFDWEIYPDHYQGELEKIAKTRLQVLSPGDYIYRKGLLSPDKKLPLLLHPNHRLLYETMTT